MKIQVLFFASLRESLGVSTLSLDVPTPMAVKQLLPFIASKRDWEIPTHFPILYAVNNEFSDGERLLQEADAIAFIPPMAGG